ncbi:putative NADH dehydrogenase [ubiquinone] 1 alpha subcomplex subunit 12 [Helianthus annuus]|nr:putative NADH dehydrogenase [ubiquinone] 1 alpha subcomplex subunit 12 [Helianthus annuus]KAJ0774371.1 putative NADH dehydrogenase [ubiquinone] 1 alpha subcomplex subunit 12 [Helianthus annuus]
MAILEARRQRVKENVALLKKEEEEKKAREGSGRKITSMGKGDGPDLKSFIQQLPVASEGKV